MDNYKREDSEEKQVNKKGSGIPLRTIVQLLALVLVTYLAWQHQALGIEKAAPIDGYCPFGGVENFLTLLVTGEFIKRIYWASIALMVITAIMTVVFGRAFCGYICPLGTLQEWIRALGRRLGIRNDYELPTEVDRYARNVKYVILVVVLYLTFTTGELVFRDYDPYVSLMHFGEEFEEKILGYSVLGLVLVTALFVKNAWCRYICPLGAFYAVLSKMKVLSIERDVDTCTDCGVCDKACIAGLDVQDSDRVTDVECVSCMKCVESCPVKALRPEVNHREVTSTTTFAAAVGGSFAVLVLIAMVTGSFQAMPASNIVAEGGSIDVANIRGSNTLEYVIATTGVPLEVFMRDLKLPLDVDTSMKLKSIGPNYDIKDDQGNVIATYHFREVIARELSIEYTSEGH